jgi:hypothetical protein
LRYDNPTLRAVSLTIRVGLSYLNKSTPLYFVSVFGRGHCEHHTPLDKRTSRKTANCLLKCSTFVQYDGSLRYKTN